MNKMKLGDILEIQPKSKRKAGEGIINGKYPFYTCSNELTKSINTADYEGDALIMGTGGMASIHYEKGKFSTSTDCLVYKSNKNVNLSLINKYLRTNIYLLENGFKGAGLRHISRDYISNITIPLPERNLQDKIVTELDLIEKTITNHNDVLKKYDTLIKSRFIEMFGDPVTNPIGWEIRSLDSLGKWESGGTPPRKNPEYFKGNIPWYSAGELNNLYLEDSIEKITEEAIKNSSAKLFKKGSLFVGMYDTAAFEMGIAKQECSSNQACANICPNTETDILWLYYELLEMKEYFLQNRRGVRQKNLNLGMIKGFEIPVPPIELQQQFATFVQQIDKSGFCD